MSGTKLLWEDWKEKAEFELGAPFCRETEERAREYFEDGLEPWEFANVCEESWLASHSY